MPILEENFRWHLEAFASELFTHMLCVIQANYTMHIMCDEDDETRDIRIQMQAFY